MKRTICIIIFTIYFYCGYSQSDSIVCTVNNMHLSRDLWEFMDFEGVNYFKVSLIGASVKNKEIIIKSKEYWANAKVVIDTIFQTETDDTSEFDFNVFSKKTNLDSVKFGFYFIHTKRYRAYKILSSDMYRFREANKRKKTISLNQKVPILTYTLPYKDKNNNYSWCSVIRPDISPDKWGEVYGLQHYIILELEIK